MRILDRWKSLGHPVVIGMLHVRALPGSPQCAGTLEQTREGVLTDARRLVEAGVDGLMLENFGDIPFYPGRVGAETVACLTMLAVAVRGAHPEVPLGINVLRNDGLSAVAIAHATGAAFVRINVLCGARVTDQGVIEGAAHEVLRLRRTLGAEQVAILADVDVKHSAPLGEGRSVEIEVDDLVHRALADALIVSGTGTGKATDPRKVAVVKAAAGKGRVPVFVGSGVTEENVAELASHADGFIVGTSLKEAGVMSAVDAGKAGRLVKAVRALRKP
ncbi:MAG: BtpA/SgcQ family protein [Phycisphaerae bacterium]